MLSAKAITTTNQVPGQLVRGVGCRDKATFLKLYWVYVRPHLEYVVAVWGLGLRRRRNVCRRYSEELSTLHGRSTDEASGAENQVEVPREW